MLMTAGIAALVPSLLRRLPGQRLDWLLGPKRGPLVWWVEIELAATSFLAAGAVLTSGSWSLALWLCAAVPCLHAVTWMWLAALRSKQPKALKSTPRYIALGVLAAIVAFLYAGTLTVFIPAVGTDASLGDTSDAVLLVAVPVVLFPLAACGVGLIVYLCTHRDLFRAVLALLLLGLALELVAFYWAGVGSAV